MLYLFKYDKSFLWFFDGLYQQVPFFAAEGNWLKELLKGHVVLWNPEMGYGFDNLIFLGNTIGNPVNLVSLFYTTKNVSWMINLTVPVILWLAGLSFIYCARSLSYRNDGLWLGALVYVYSGYSAVSFIQTEFLYALVLAPLMLVSIEKVFNGKYLMYPVVVCLFTLYYVMQVYIALLFAVVYCIVRLVVTRELKPKAFLLHVLRFSALTLLGLGMAAVLFFPIVHLLIHMDRLSLERTYPLYYNKAMYANMVFNLTNYVFVGPDAYIGTGAAGVFGWAYLVFMRKKNARARALRAMFVICLIVLVVPFLGRITNAMSYASNRWTWVLSLISGLAFLEFYQNMQKDDKLFKLCVSMVGLYCIVSVGLRFYTKISIPSTADLQALVAVGVVMMGLSLHAAYSNMQKLFTFCGICLSLVAMCIQQTQFSSTSLGNAYNVPVAQNPLSIAYDLPVDTNEGVDMDGFAHISNSNVFLDKREGSFYNSYYDSRVDKLHALLGLNTSSKNHDFSSYNARQVIEAYAGTKYYYITGASSGHHPSAFELTRTVDFYGQPYAIFENKAMLPTAFVPQASLHLDSFTALGIAEREQALSKYLVSDDATNTEATDLGVSELPHTFVAGKNVVIEGNAVRVPQANGEATITIPKHNNIELSVEFTGLHCYDFEGEEQDNAYMVVSNEANSASYRIIGPKYHTYGGKRDALLNIGNIDTGTETLTVRFINPGVYTFNTLRVVAVDSATTEKNLKSMISPLTENQTWATNSFSVDYNSEGNPLVFRIPYSEGWTATIDGKSATLKNADIAFMSLDVPQGKHHIQLSYVTPWLKEGLITSLVSWVILGLMALVIRIKKKGNPKQDTPNISPTREPRFSYTPTRADTNTNE